MGEKNWTRLCEAIRTVPCPNLCSLSIPNNNIGEKGCKQFTRLCFENKVSELREINLAGNRIGNNAFLELLRAFQITNMAPQLTSLNLERNGIGMRGVKLGYSTLRMCSFNQLESLRLGGVHSQSR